MSSSSVGGITKSPGFSDLHAQMNALQMSPASDDIAGAIFNKLVERIKDSKSTPIVAARVGNICSKIRSRMSLQRGIAILNRCDEVGLKGNLFEMAFVKLSKRDLNHFQTRILVKPKQFCSQASKRLERATPLGL